jgi:hypothetical protein
VAKTLECHILFLAPIDAKIPSDLTCFLNSPVLWKERYGDKFVVYSGVIEASECVHSLASLKQTVVELVMTMNPVWIDGACRFQQPKFEPWYRE